jgi:hypothetical protein
MTLKFLNRDTEHEIGVFLIDVLGKYKKLEVDKYIAYEQCKKFINQYSMSNDQYEYYIKFTIDMLELEDSSR